MGAILALTATDAELAQRCLQGDQQAWAEIVRQYSRRIYNLAYRFTTSHSAAEDLTQEVMLNAFRSIRQEHADRWRVRASCNAALDSWSAHISLRMIGANLRWSSERGTETYLRCGRPASMISSR